MTATTNRVGRPRSTSLPYVPIDPHLENNPRIRRAIRRLRPHAPDPNTVAWYVVRLWLHCGQCAPDGVLGALTADDLADIAGWPGDADVYRQALFDAGLLCTTDDGVVSVHDWDDYGGITLKKRQQNNQRQAEWRARANTARKALAVVEHTRNTDMCGLSPLHDRESRGKGKGKDIDRSIHGSNGIVTVTIPTPTNVGDDDLERIPDATELRGADVERLLSRSQCGHPTPALDTLGGGAGSMGRLAELSPLYAWELRVAVQRAGPGKRAGYLATIIEQGRHKSWSPPPRATAPVGARSTSTRPTASVGTEASEHERAVALIRDVGRGVAPTALDDLARQLVQLGDLPEVEARLRREKPTNVGAWLMRERDRVRREAADAIAKLGARTGTDLGAAMGV